MLCLISSLFLWSGCNSYTPKVQGDGGQINAANVTPDFTAIQTKILQPYCIMCHSSAAGNAGGINVENYANVIKYIDQIQSSVTVRQTMPPGEHLPQNEMDALSQWITDGAKND